MNKKRQIICFRCQTLRIRINQIRKYSKHLIGYSLLVWLPGFYFLSFDILSGHISFPIAALMVTIGIVGWISKPRTKFIRTGYATQLDVFLGWLWERFAPRWFTFCLLLGIIWTNFFSYTLFERKLEWKNVRKSLLNSKELTLSFNSEPNILSHKQLVSNEQFIQYEVTINESDRAEIYKVTTTTSYEFIELIKE